MSKCNICGINKKITIRCSSCGQMCCLNDFYCKLGICADCVTLKYNEYYEEKIEAYAT
jgi:hypothetical protein